MQKLLRYSLTLCLFVSSLAVAQEPKRHYTTTVGQPTISDDGNTRTVTWRVTTVTRFDHKDGAIRDLDTRPFLTSVTSKEIKPISTAFKHPDRKSDGDPKRTFEKPIWRWNCQIVKRIVQQGQERIVNVDNLEYITETAAAPHARAIADTTKRSRPDGAYTYSLTLASAPPPAGVIRYSEYVDGFFSFFHFNRGNFETDVIAKGPKNMTPSRILRNARRVNRSIR